MALDTLTNWLTEARDKVGDVLADEEIYEMGPAMGALIELGRICQVPQKHLDQAERLAAPVCRQEEETVAALTPEDALVSIDALLEIRRRADCTAQLLDRMAADSKVFVLVNPVRDGCRPAVLTYNDLGAYSDPWDALADLYHQRLEFENEYLYLAIAKRFEPDWRSLYFATC